MVRVEVPEQPADRLHVPACPEAMLAATVKVWALPVPTWPVTEPVPTVPGRHRR